MHYRYVALMVIMALGLVGCGSSDDSTEVVSTVSPAPVANTLAAQTIDDDCQNLTQSSSVELIAGDSFFGPECVTVKSDATLTLRNEGIRTHNFTISEGEFGTAPWLVHIGDVVTRKSASTKGAIGDLVEPGIYEFFCSLHAGMDGVMEIVPPVEV
jgi:plastocyanin